MIAMGSKQRQLFRQLVRLADGDPTVVYAALRDQAKHGGVVDYKTVVENIQERTRARGAVPHGLQGQTQASTE